jgi:electron transport complex protein RnfB
MLSEEMRVEKFTGVAVIDEQACIGCTKCIPPCPVDAIVGAAKHMHTVIASECTGCGDCIAPCPVDCITMRPLQPLPDEALLREKALLAERRHHVQALRRGEELAEQEARAKARKAALRPARAG